MHSDVAQSSRKRRCGSRFLCPRRRHISLQGHPRHCCSPDPGSLLPYCLRLTYAVTIVCPRLASNTVASSSFVRIFTGLIICALPGALPDALCGSSFKAHRYFPTLLFFYISHRHQSQKHVLFHLFVNIMFVQIQLLYQQHLCTYLEWVYQYTLFLVYFHQ